MKCSLCKAKLILNAFKLVSGRIRSIYECSSCRKRTYKVGHVWFEYND